MATNSKNIYFAALVWALIWIFTTFFITGGFEHTARFAYRSLFLMMGIVVVVYINLRFLFPLLYLKKRIWLYALCSFILVALITWALHSDQVFWSDLLYMGKKKLGTWKGGPRGPRSFMHNARWFQRSMPFVVSLLGSTLVEATRLSNLREKRLIRTEKEQLETELKFLKSQVNPHFLFNVLNNIYTLAVIKSEKTPDSLLQLSHLLRYMLYDSNEDRVSLKSEIDYLKNYVELFRLKNSKGLNIKVAFDESRPEIRIAPLLFIPFLENAFKHSKVEDTKTGFIETKLSADDKAIEFWVKNSVPEHTYTKDKVGGIGLENIRKRLALLYPNAHTLTIDNNEAGFAVYLRVEYT